METKRICKKNAPVLDEYKSVGSRLKSLYPRRQVQSETSKRPSATSVVARSVKNSTKNTATSKKEYTDLDKASQTIDDYLESLRDEPEQKRKKES